MTGADILLITQGILALTETLARLADSLEEEITPEEMAASRQRTTDAMARLRLAVEERITNG